LRALQRCADVVRRAETLPAAKAAALNEEMKHEISDHLNYAHEHGTDRPEIVNWTRSH